MHERDELDVFALFSAMWRQKNLILLIMFLFTMLASLYAFIATPEYRVSSILRPTQIKSLDVINRSQIYSLTPEAALQRVYASLESYENRLGFYRANPELFKGIEDSGKTPEQNFEEFNRSALRVMTDESTTSGIVSVLLELNYSNKVDGVQLLNRFVDYTLQVQRASLAADFDGILANRLSEIDKFILNARASYVFDKDSKIARLEESDEIRRAQLQDELAALRQQLKTLRKDRIAQLNEAILVARSLGIKKPTTPSSLGESDAKSFSGVRTEVNNQAIPLYFMGTDALEAERTALNQRGSDEFTDVRVSQIAKELQMLQVNREVQALKKRANEDFYLDVEAQRKEALRLKALNIDVGNLQLVEIDRRAVQPISPLKPKKALVITLGALFGLMFGFGVALIRELVRLRSVSLQNLDLGAPVLPVATTKVLLDLSLIHI